MSEPNLKGPSSALLYLKNMWMFGLQVLHTNTSQLNSGLLVEDFKLVREAAMRANPRIMNAATLDQSEAGSEYVDEEANSYFQRIYVGQLTIDDVVDMLKRFNSASSSPYVSYSFFP